MREVGYQGSQGRVLDVVWYTYWCLSVITTSIKQFLQLSSWVTTHYSKVDPLRLVEGVTDPDTNHHRPGTKDTKDGWKIPTKRSEEWLRYS